MGVAGIEPTASGLEPDILPLNYTPLKDTYGFLNEPSLMEVFEFNNIKN